MAGPSYAGGVVLFDENPIRDANDDAPPMNHGDLEDDGDEAITSAWVYLAWGGLVCLLLVGIYSIIRGKFSLGPHEVMVTKNEENGMSDEARRLQLRGMFEMCESQMEISEDALIPVGDCSDEEQARSHLSSPPSSTTADEESGKSSPILVVWTKEKGKDEKYQGGGFGPVVACCAICLEDYRVGEVVVWSCAPHSECPHVYHRDCMVEYLIRYRGGADGSPCPSCRRNYLDCPTAD